MGINSVVCIAIRRALCYVCYVPHNTKQSKTSKHVL